MPLGVIDCVSSSGHIEGWASDDSNPSKPCQITVRDEAGQDLAWGLAHLYREDLARAGIGLGWCAFRLRAVVSPPRLRDAPLILHDRPTGAPLCAPVVVSFVVQPDAPIATAETLVATDPTVLSDMRQLQACEPLFRVFIRDRGLNAFVRAAYIYILGRPADDTGLALYGGLIRQATMSPLALLHTLHDSDEFRSRPRALAAPNTPAFPFRRV
jgi:hypothetical protein